jgi:hypothetical protein
VNDQTVLAAIATHLIAATPPTGYALRAVHTYPPDNLAVVPAAVILAGDDKIEYGASARTITLNVSAAIYILPLADLARKYTDLNAWRTFLRDALIDGVTLDNTSQVAQASVVSTSFGTDVWGDQDYLTITATIEVSAVEAINTSA